jgi:cytoskeletal protein CcmA (bactofilin family)
MTRRALWLLMSLAPLFCPAAAHAAGGGVTYTIAEGETHVGDLYLFASSPRIRIAGTQQGDLYAFTQALEVSGTVTGDINAWGQDVNISGTVNDSVRIFAQSLTLSGTINGDLLAFCQKIRTTATTRITGDVKMGGAEVEIDGEIDGELEATGGEIKLNGRVGRDATLKADIVDISPEARIGGDLDYTSRKVIDFGDETIVSGTIEFSPEKKRPPVTSRGAGRWVFCVLTALIVGLAALALFRRRTPEVVGTVATDSLRSAGVGFLATIVVPVALLIACVLIITIPLVLIAGLLFALMIYVAKMPVAIWLGSAILGRLGRPKDSPYTALLVGVPVLYLLFAVPYIGTISWFAATFIGLGAILLTAWSIRQARLAAGGPAPPAPPPPSPEPAVAP